MVFLSDVFVSVFRYLRGRQSYAFINTCIDEFNAAVNEKYKILSTSRQKQSDSIRKAIWDYKEQECKDTKGSIASSLHRFTFLTLPVACRCFVRDGARPEEVVALQTRQQWSCGAHHLASLQPHSRDSKQRSRSTCREVVTTTLRSFIAQYRLCSQNPSCVL